MRFESASLRSANCGSYLAIHKTKKNPRVEHCDGAAVPLYHFEAEGPGWSDYQDDDGIELPSDAKALAYAYSMIRELSADFEGSNRPLYLLVKDSARKTIFRIAFE